MGNVKYLMVLAIAAVGLFAMPQMLATYAGTHTVEYNAPTDGSGSSGKALDCRECHQYIFDAANPSDSANAQKIWTAHSNAASDTNYTTYVAYYGTNMNTTIAGIDPSLIVDPSPLVGPGPFDRFFTANVNKSNNKVRPGAVLGHNATSNKWQVVNASGSGSTIGEDATDSYGGKEWSACLVCHRAAYFYGGTHTRVQVRGCTNEWCHGANTTVANSATGRKAGVSYMADINNYTSSKAAQIGKQLNKNTDAHNAWFDRSAAVDDTYQNALTGEFIKKDYYTCLGCHTHADVKLDITKSTGFNATLTTTQVTYLINASNTTPLQSVKQGGAFK